MTPSILTKVSPLTGALNNFTLVQFPSPAKSSFFDEVLEMIEQAADGIVNDLLVTDRLASGA